MQFPTSQRIRIAGDRLLVCDCRAHIAEEWRIFVFTWNNKQSYSLSEPSAQVFLEFSGTSELSKAHCLFWSNVKEGAAELRI